ncbi:MAG: endonuclease V [Nitrososphaerota archaeon]
MRSSHNKLYNGASYSEAIKLQEELAKKVITKDSISEIKNVCAVDVSYKDDMAFCSAVVINKKTVEVVECINTQTAVKYSYIPGLLMLREAEPVMSGLKLLKNDFDLLLVDGHGQLHPRRCGLACYLGITLNKPTIGVAKSLLCGTIKGNFVELDGKKLGAVIENKQKKIFVSVGHKISLKSAAKIVTELIKENEWLPEPLRVADMNSKRESKSYIS